MFQGVIPALITPFTDGGDVDVAAVDKIVDFLLQRGAQGLYVCGSTGEGLGQTVAQRKTMCAAAVQACAGRVPVMVMVSAPKVEDSKELARHAEETGADAISCIAPPGQPGQFDAAVTYWKEIGASCQLPFYVYWIAATADKSVTPEKFVAAMAGIPTFQGVKFTDTDFFKFQQLLALGVPNAVTGPDEMMVAGLAMGSHGAIGSTYNVQLRRACKVFTTFRAGKVKEATELQWRMNRMIASLIELCNCAERGTNIIAGIKLILQKHYKLPITTRCTSLVTPLSPENERLLLQAAAQCEIE